MYYILNLLSRPISKLNLTLSYINSFDDKDLYDEIKKDNNERSMPIIQIEDEDNKTIAKKIFSNWYNNNKNIRY